MKCVCYEMCFNFCRKLCYEIFILCDKCSANFRYDILTETLLNRTRNGRQILTVYSNVKFRENQSGDSQGVFFTRRLVA
jgi:hypothetical protein